MIQTRCYRKGVLSEGPVPAEAGAHHTHCRSIPDWHRKYPVLCTLSQKTSQSIFLGKVSTEMESHNKKYLCSLCGKADQRRGQKQLSYKTPADTWCLKWCQRLYLLCCNSCVALRSVWSTVYVSFRLLLRAHGSLAHWGCSLICSQFPPTPSQRHIRAFIPTFLHTPSATRDRVPPDNWNYSADLFGIRRYAVIR